MNAMIAVSAMLNAAVAAATPPVGLPQHTEAIGATRTLLRRACDRLCAAPLNNADFVLADVSLQQKRRFIEYSGDISGRMLGAMNEAAPLLGLDTPFCDVLLKGFEQYQKADGHFGADQDLAKEVNQARDMPICWGNGRLLLALAQRYRNQPDEKLLAMAKRLGDYVISTRAYYGKRENFERVGGAYSSGFTTCYPSMIDGLVALGEITKDVRYYDEARFIADLSLLDKEFEGHHSHGRLSAYRGMLDLDRATGKDEFLEKVQAGCKTIAEQYLLPTGGIPEIFNADFVRDEGCSVGDWVRVNLYLWRATQDPRYLDLAEQTLTNHIPATMFSNGGFGHRNLQLLKHGDKMSAGAGIGSVGSEAYWCCSMHVTQVIAEAVRWSAVTVDDAVAVTWLAEAKSTLKLIDREVKLTVEKTGLAAWRITLDGAGEVPIRLRMPAWAHGMTVDGKAVEAQDRWVRFTRKAGPTTSFDVTFTEPLLLAGPSALPIVKDQPRRLLYGADMLCLPEADVAGLPASESMIPDIMLKADPVVPDRDGRIAAGLAVAHDKWAPVRLVPVSRRPPGSCRYLFNVKRVPANDFDGLLAGALKPTPGLTPVEIFFASDSQYAIHLDGRHRGGGNGYHESPRLEVYVAPGRHVLAVKTLAAGQCPALIGTVRIGTREIVTRPEDWSAAVCPSPVPAEWLTDISKGPSERVKLTDLGGYGAEPWGPMPAAFAGTKARWLRPELPADRAKGPWLLRCEITVPDVPAK